MRTSRSAGVVLVLVTAAALTGCGSSGSSSAPKVSPLSKADATSALLTQDNLGSGFTSRTDDASSTDAPGCLAPLDKLTEAKAPVKAKSEYQATSDTGFPLLASEVTSYRSVAAAKGAISAARTSMASCTSVDDTAKDGTITKLSVTITDEKIDGADDEFNLEATGTLTEGGQTVPFGLFLAAVRIKNSISATSIGDLAGAFPQLDDFVTVAVDRLKAVVAGRTPPTATITPAG
ncbi:MAG: hypothetical protein JWP74_3017 [Marmoricola sp.]|nr:hypothetical protein [Marmoricola sp.]